MMRFGKLQLVVQERARPGRECLLRQAAGASRGARAEETKVGGELAGEPPALLPERARLGRANLKAP